MNAPNNITASASSFRASFRHLVISGMMLVAPACQEQDPFEAGEKAYARQDYDRAIACFSEAIRRHPSGAQLYLHRGACYDEKDDVAKALADYNEALRLDHYIPAACLGRGTIFYGKGDYEEAEANFLEALKLYPDYPEACNNLAWLLATCPKASLRDGRKAQELADRAFEHWTEKPAYVLATRAAAFAEVGDFEQAILLEKEYLASDQLSEKERSNSKHRVALYEAHKPVRSTNGRDSD